MRAWEFWLARETGWTLEYIRSLDFFSEFWPMVQVLRRFDREEQGAK